MEAGRNPVGRLQEACQRWRLPLPTYREAQGSYQEFGCECLLATAEGAEPVVLYHRARTKKASKAGAAQTALDHLAEHRPELLEPPPTPAVDEDVMAGLGVWRKGGQLNKQHESPVAAQELARETERLDHTRVGLGVARLIQQARTKQGLSQKDLAARMNEKQAVIAEYESGQAVPGPHILSKMERALGVHLSGERAGLARGRGRGSAGHSSDAQH